MNSNNSTAISMAEECPVISDAQEDVLAIRDFLEKNYRFRFNTISGKVEYLTLSQQPIADESSNEPAGSDSQPSWTVLDQRATNSVILHAKLKVATNNDPARTIERIIHSTETPLFNPIQEWLGNLPKWDGENRLVTLFSRIPGISSEEVLWCTYWFRGMVAHWLQLDMLHGNEIVPVLIGKQGCGKSTFCIRLLPEPLRCYFLDRINFDNKFDADMALTHNLLVNIDEFDRLNARKQADLKHTLSRVKVNGRPIFGSAEEDRPRYASFIATTNHMHPLADSTGSRRFICIHVTRGQLIDNLSSIDYEQLYAQAVEEVRAGKRHWLTQEETNALEISNRPFRQGDENEDMIRCNFRLAHDNEDIKPLLTVDIINILKERYPNVMATQSFKTSIGTTLKSMGCKAHRTNRGMSYFLVPLA